MRKLLGFTLAEVLITLGVIGVVAAMTIPNLVSRIQERVWLSQFNKVTSSVQNAYKLIYDEYGPTSNWELNDVGYDMASIDKVVSLFSPYIPNHHSNSQHHRYYLYSILIHCSFGILICVQNSMH